MDRFLQQCTQTRVYKMTNECRAGHTMTVFNGYLVLTAASSSNQSLGLWIGNTNTIFQQTSNITWTFYALTANNRNISARSGHSITIKSSGMAYIYGGSMSNGTMLNDVYSFNVSTILGKARASVSCSQVTLDNTSPIRSFPFSAGHKAFLYGERYVIIQGFTFFVWDTQANTAFAPNTTRKYLFQFICGIYPLVRMHLFL